MITPVAWDERDRPALDQPRDHRLARMAERGVDRHAHRVVDKLVKPRAPDDPDGRGKIIDHAPTLGDAGADWTTAQADGGRRIAGLWMDAQVVAAAFEPPPVLVPELPLLDPGPEFPEPGFVPFAFGVALGFASALGFAEPPDSPDLLSAAGLLAELPESAEPESEPELEPEPEPESDDGADPDPPASTRAFESLRLSVR
jgi:hypothetical protein